MPFHGWLSFPLFLPSLSSCRVTHCPSSRSLQLSRSLSVSLPGRTHQPATVRRTIQPFASAAQPRFSFPTTTTITTTTRENSSPTIPLPKNLTPLFAPPATDHRQLRVASRGAQQSSATVGSGIAGAPYACAETQNPRVFSVSASLLVIGKIFIPMDISNKKRIIETIL